MCPLSLCSKWMQSIAATQLATQQNALALAVSEACQCRLSPGHPVLVLAKSTLQCLGFALELKHIGKFVLENSHRQILFEAQVHKFSCLVPCICASISFHRCYFTQQHSVIQRHKLLCQHDWRKRDISMDMDVIAENCTHVKKVWKTAWALGLKQKQTTTKIAVGEMKLTVQFEDDPEGARRTTMNWHMQDELIDYLNHEVCWPDKHTPRCI